MSLTGFPEFDLGRIVSDIASFLLYTYKLREGYKNVMERKPEEPRNSAF